MNDKEYICYVVTYYPSFKVSANSEAEAKEYASEVIWDEHYAETYIDCELISGENEPQSTLADIFAEKQKLANQQLEQLTSDLEKIREQNQ